MANAYMIGCEVGTASGDDRPLVVGTYAEGTLEVKLTKPGRFGTLRELLAKYDVSTDNLPLYIRNALEFETTLQKLEYSSQKVATFTGANLQITAIDTANKELEGATVVKVDKGGKLTYLIKDTNQKALTQFNVTQDGDSPDGYAIGKASYTFIVVAQYRSAFELIPGLMGIKFLAFSISNIQKAEDLQGEVDNALKSVLGVNPPVKATNELQAQS